jgi:hypothetical protein
LGDPPRELDKLPSIWTQPWATRDVFKNIRYVHSNWRKNCHRGRKCHRRVVLKEQECRADSPILLLV